MSVLFADLVGFTPFTEAHDAEEVRAMLTRYFERAQRVVERFGGEVDKFIGDAVTAFWGARVALEDDAERAVRAALELVDEVAELGEEIGVPDLALRAGVLSGETSVGPGGNSTGLVVGDIVNTASRLQSVAQPGTVYVGESTKDLAGASVRFEQVGPHDLKGKSDAVDVWRAVEVVAQRGGRGRTVGLEPHFVGREYEMRLLKDQLHATGHEQRARLVSIVGEGGIGKSRLAWELLKYVDGLADTFFWHQGRSPAYGEGVTLWALGEMVRQRARIAETDDVLKSRTKLQSAVAQYVSDAEDVRWITPRLAGLLGLDEMPEGDRADLFGALRTFFQRISEAGSTVLVFEDLHWADEGLLEFIVDLVEKSPRHPILVVTLARPALLERRPDWGAARRGFTSAHIGPLTDADMGELVMGMAPGIEPATVDLVVSSAAGVPLYAVEYVRMLVAAGNLVRDGSVYRQVDEVESLALPDSLQAMVGARLDRLDGPERALIQDASVLGQSFTLEALTASSEKEESDLVPVLDRLVRKEVLRRDDDPRSPERGQHQFVQSMIREVAYGRLSKADRRRRHLNVARRFEAMGATEFAAVIASHYLSALEAGHDDEVAASARRSLLSAARRAADLHSHKQCLALVRQGLDIPGDEAGRVPLWQLGAVAASSLFENDTAVEMARNALAREEARGDPAGVTKAAQVLGYVLSGANETAQAVAAMEGHFDPKRASEPAMMELGAELARANMLEGSMETAAAVARDTMMAAEEAHNTELVIEAMNTRGTALSGLGRVHESIALLREAVRLANESGSPEAEARAMNNFMVCNGANGLLANLDVSERYADLAVRLDIVDYRARAAIRRGGALVASGLFEAAAELYEDMAVGPDHFWGLTVSADMESLRWILDGDRVHLADGQRLLEQALKMLHVPQFAAWVQSQQSRLAFQGGEWREAHARATSIDKAAMLPETDAWVIPTLAAIRLRDPALLESAWDKDSVPIGRRFEAIDMVADAARSHFEGAPIDITAEKFRAAVAATEADDGVVAAMVLRAIFAGLMEGSEQGREAGTQAYEWFRSAGAGGYLALFEDVWPRTLGQAEAG